ncbi:tRNA-dihydrouridine synthase 1 [Marchantia polymorpha subsp. ruderalis]|uniref:tRNA-dihydrouridine(16/17) synthase [NAD(P)(+)] n=2 Tax=Marchantia polymorpha TaxID=3197 RepID=A0AAF6BH10_MARPO|nr:hypothetical protein MARPO_0048s0005 [Marchantia polymorpha]BBN11294.1 hypothetical protein Mp_5g10670 [Marchantia polymorpha subsp. ruderalis]|eukprot:PTQ38877.1 hypothetical protein MARPO_0048s0005 [Marchantia polymorpha]
MDSVLGHCALITVPQTSPSRAATCRPVFVSSRRARNFTQFLHSPRIPPAVAFRASFRAVSHENCFSALLDDKDLEHSSTAQGGVGTEPNFEAHCDGAVKSEICTTECIEGIASVELNGELKGVREPWDEERGVAAAWEHWRALGAPKLHLAPMVDQSELPFRMLCRRYGATGAYTPMLHARVFVDDRNYRRDEFSTCDGDRPLFVQFCANEPETLLQAALMVQSQCDYVDINLGCPQRVARRGNYGAFLMDDLPLVQSLVSNLASNLSVPVSCKIRLFPELADTLAYARMLQAAGCSLLAVHGRTRDQKCSQLVRADWDAIRAVKEAVRIPVLANGNIRWMEDVHACIAATGVDGVMSAESLLENPALFAGFRTLMHQDPTNSSVKIIDERLLCLEYFDLVEQHPVPMRMVLRHIFKLLTSYWFQHHTDLRDELHHRQYNLSLDFVRDLVHRLIARGPPPFSPHNGCRPPPAELPSDSTPRPTSSSSSSSYSPDMVEQNRLKRAVRRRPSRKIKLPDWGSDQTVELVEVGA